MITNWGVWAFFETLEDAKKASEYLGNFKDSSQMGIYEAVLAETTKPRKSDNSFKFYVGRREIAEAARIIPLPKYSFIIRPKGKLELRSWASDIEEEKIKNIIKEKEIEIKRV